MERLLDRLYLPAGTAYRRNRPINRTKYPSLPMGRDPQARLPAAWCGSCGGEVYRPGLTRCVRCAPADG